MGHPAADALARLRGRLRDAVLQLAVVGQFKRGKSTVLNAILGDAWLPMAVVPATAIPTFIAWAATIRVRIDYLDGRAPETSEPADAAAVREVLRDAVTEEGNPRNRRGIARVELRLPAAWLRDGIVLIDTPGIGSTLQHNTDATLGVLPECDAAIFLLAADPPVTDAEAQFLQTLRLHVARLYVVLNKIDQIDAEERAALLGFVTSVLTAEGETAPRILQLSARQALEARQRGEEAGVGASGLGAIRDEILAPLQRQKQATLRQAVREKAARHISQVLADMALSIRAWELPLEEIDARRRALDKALAEVERERSMARDLLEADQRRAATTIEAMAVALRERARAALLGSLRQGDDAAMEAALAGAVPALFNAEMAAQVEALRQRLQVVFDAHAARADALVGTIRHAAATIFEVSPGEAEASEPYHVGAEPYWVSQPWQNRFLPSPASLVERLLPARLRRLRARARLEARLDAVVARNVENLRWSMLRGLDTAFRRVSAESEARLAGIMALTGGAIDEAARRRRERGEQAEEVLAALRRDSAELTRLTEALANGVASVGGCG